MRFFFFRILSCRRSAFERTTYSWQARPIIFTKEKVCGCASTEATNPVFRSRNHPKCIEIGFWGYLEGSKSRSLA